MTMTTTTTATRTSLEKRNSRSIVFFFAIVPTSLISHNVAKQYPGKAFRQVQVEKSERKENSPSCAHQCSRSSY